MEKLYVHEKRPNGEISTVGLYYSREEAEGIVKQLRELPEKENCEYTIAQAVTGETENGEMGETGGRKAGERENRGR